MQGGCSDGGKTDIIISLDSGKKLQAEAPNTSKRDLSNGSLQSYSSKTDLSLSDVSLALPSKTNSMQNTKAADRKHEVQADGSHGNNGNIFKQGSQGSPITGWFIVNHCFNLNNAT